MSVQFAQPPWNLKGILSLDDIVVPHQGDDLGPKLIGFGLSETGDLKIAATPHHIHVTSMGRRSSLRGVLDFARSSNCARFAVIACESGAPMPVISVYRSGMQKVWSLGLHGGNLEVPSVDAQILCVAHR
jgi:hypothetical protein